MDEMLQRFAADDNLTLEGLEWISLTIQVYLVVHGAYVSSHLQISEYLDELLEVFRDKVGHFVVSCIHRAHSRRCGRICLPLCKRDVIEFLCRLENDLLLVLVIEAYQDQFYLLKESPP